jgi:hypothetical protein
MVRADEALTLQLGDKPFQPILNRDGIATKSNTVGAVVGPVFGEGFWEGLDLGAQPLGPAWGNGGSAMQRRMRLSSDAVEL